MEFKKMEWLIWLGFGLIAIALGCWLEYKNVGQVSNFGLTYYIMSGLIFGPIALAAYILVLVSPEKDSEI